MMKTIGLFLTLAASFAVWAGPGDTTEVLVHDDVDMTWYGNYDQTGVFPNGSVTYEKVLMEYTLGCASGGCSDWDYTTQIYLMHGLNRLDSNIAQVDTLSQNPLVLDTTWNVFEVTEPFELGRVITPYGGYMANNQNGFTNNWNHRFLFDVTDYQTLLRDSVNIRAHYSGWSSGFSVKLRFLFIEGTPARTVDTIINLYRGSFGYQNSAQFESQHLPQRTVFVPNSIAAARLHVITSGHGFDNNVYCAEFCQRWYRIFTNGTQRYQKNMWRDDCGLNPIYPQGGTWLYDRADWCPGLDVVGSNYELGGYLTVGDTNTIDMDLQNYTWTGTQTPVHTITNTLFLYSSVNTSLDASVDAIISPSDHETYSRRNPICSQALVRIENRGTNPITSLDFTYGTPNHQWQFSWSGTIEIGEKQEIQLPVAFDTLFQQNNTEFIVEIDAVNGQQDQNAFNNEMRSTFEQPEVYQDGVVLDLRTNSKGFQTSWTLVDQDGNVFSSGQNLQNYTNYRDTIALPSGCYVLKILDSGKNGLSWWADNDGSGYARLRDLNGGILRIFKADFGTEIYHPFTIESNFSSSELNWKNQMDVYPTLAQDYTELHYGFFHQRNVNVEVYNTMGQVVYQSDFVGTSGTFKIDLSDFHSGVYSVRVSSGNEFFVQKITVQH